ncbi:hypothetical protein KIN20_016123 [Parelaphostrongylus tenuis]|uniref:Uncharacterized protein n=1 Tax=Parelaphostrongylus tenuis TaxID=148309 RepID=A0AAD5MJI3_PARTN|nr:hypothetical protein KIN20_016123 [Parelaphostrongylus tenuis]
MGRLIIGNSTFDIKAIAILMPVTALLSILSFEILYEPSGNVRISRLIVRWMMVYWASSNVDGAHRLAICQLAHGSRML